MDTVKNKNYALAYSYLNGALEYLPDNLSRRLLDRDIKVDPVVIEVLENLIKAARQGAEKREDRFQKGKIMDEIKKGDLIDIIFDVSDELPDGGEGRFKVLAFVERGISVWDGGYGDDNDYIIEWREIYSVTKVDANEA